MNNDLMNGIEPQGKPWTQEATHKTHPGASPGEFLRLKGNENNSEKFNADMLTFAEACLYLKISKSFLYKATSDRNITFFRPTGGKLIYFNRNDLDKWLLQNRHPSKSELLLEKISYNQNRRDLL